MPNEAIYGIVLLSALGHALWNAIVKSSGDRLLTLSMMRIAGLMFGCSVIFIAPLPAPESWPYLIAAVFVHYAYYAFMLNAYRVGDFSQVYPIARGIAPVLVTGLAAFFADEKLTGPQLSAVLVASAGIIGLAFNRGKTQGKAILFAIGMGLSITTYTFINGLGVRASGTVFGYLAWMEIGTGIGVLAFASQRRGTIIIDFALSQGFKGFVAGFLSTGGYLIGLWAISILPMGPVTAVRETSVIFGVIIGTIVLRESFGAQRIVMACLVTSGIVALTLLRS